MSPTKATKKPAPAATSPKSADKKPPAKRAQAASSEAPPSGPISSGPAGSGPVGAAPSTPAPASNGSPAATVEPAGNDGERISEPPGVDKLDGKDGKREKAPSAVQALAMELVAAADGAAVLRHATGLEDERETIANQAARLVQELAELKPELLVPLIDRFSRLLVSKNRRVVASAAGALAPLSRIAPAKVAKQLPVLTPEEGKDGLVRTFAGLCTASVAYQKRLEPALARALGEADPKLLVRWTEIVLPALKGEPHARARAVVEERLPHIPRPIAQKIADFLGIKLRPLPR
jgi:hypothetical protein